MIRAIAGRELRALFLSPLAWVVLAAVQLILAYEFLIQMELYFQVQPRLAAAGGGIGITDLVVAPLYSNAAVVLLLIVPLVTMRLISEERRSHTMPLLFSAPVSMTEIVLGKYLGILGFLFIMVVMVSLMPLSLLLWGGLDMGKFAACALGLILLVGSFAALGLFMSTLTAQPTVAGVATFGALLLLWVINWVGAGDGGSGNALTYLSLLHHYQPLLEGIFGSRDLVYYLLFTLVFMVLAVQRLDAQRLQH